ncbi:MAG: glycosyltransferase family 4 protein [Ignavibacteria bacterium]|nr:glycosyltransferase family 4 protein [Ignavibacteria bacterium]
MSRYKIAHITQFYYPIIGGQQLYIKNLIDLLGDEIEQFVIQGWLEKSNYNYVKNLSNFGSQIESRMGRLFPYFSWYRSLYSLKFEKKLLKSFDKLLLHYPFFYPSVKWHEDIIVLSHGVLWNRPFKDRTDRVFKKLAVETKKKCKIVSNDTDYLREIGIDAKPMQNEFCEIEKNVFYFPNCVDTDIFCPSESKKENIILVPRNLRPDRGIHLAIESFGLISKHFPDYRLVIVGALYEGSNYFNNCISIAKDYNIIDKMEMHSTVSQNKLLNFYRRAKLTLIPSIDFEGTSLSALESMACGTPVISTNVGGLADIPCVHAETNSADFSEKIIYVLNNLEIFSKEQTQSVNLRFNIGKWTSNWNKLLTT